MHRFFDHPTTRWHRLTGCLHLYVPLHADDPARTGSRDALRALTPIAGLGVQPEEFLHLTVQRFEAYEEDLVADPWVRWRHSLSGNLASVAAFDVDLAAPRPREHAVESVGRADERWDALLAVVRETTRACGLESTLVAPPPIPHFSLAYAREEVPDGPVSAALRATRGSTVRIGEIALVAVDQDPARGVFEFRALDVWPLSGSPVSGPLDRVVETFSHDS